MKSRPKVTSKNMEWLLNTPLGLGLIPTTKNGKTPVEITTKLVISDWRSSRITSTTFRLPTEAT